MSSSLSTRRLSLESQEAMLHDFYLDALKGLAKAAQLKLWDEELQMFNYGPMENWMKEMINLFVRFYSIHQDSMY